MAIHCSKCGEELLGAVNRCWRCGQAFAVAPPPNEAPTASVAATGDQPLVEIVDAERGDAYAYTAEAGGQRWSTAPRTTAELIDARKAGMMAMGGTVTSLVLGILALVLASFWPPAAIIAIVGIGMGIWGLSSPRRNLALVGMLLCCLAIGIGTYGMARRISIAIQKNRVIPIDEPSPLDN